MRQVNSVVFRACVRPGDWKPVRREDARSLSPRAALRSLTPPAFLFLGFKAIAG